MTGWGLLWGVEETGAVILLGGGSSVLTLAVSAASAAFPSLHSCGSPITPLQHMTMPSSGEAKEQRGNVKSRQVLDVLQSMSEQRANVAHEPSASYEDRVKSLLNFDH